MEAVHAQPISVMPIDIEGGGKSSGSGPGSSSATPEFGAEIGAFSWGLLTPFKLFGSEEFLSAPGAGGKASHLVSVVKAEVKGHLEFDPPTPLDSFRLYNALGFWLVVAEYIIAALVGEGALYLVFATGLSYFVAYALYWVMTCEQPLLYQLGSLCFMLGYVGSNLFMCVHTLLTVMPAALAVVPAAHACGKAFCATLMLINAFVLYKKVAGEELVTMDMFVGSVSRTPRAARMY